MQPDLKLLADKLQRIGYRLLFLVTEPNSPAVQRELKSHGESLTELAWRIRPQTEETITPL